MFIRLSENFRAVFYAPFYATIALGHYREAGLDVQLMTSPAPGSAVSGLLDGTIDVTWGGPMRVMKARDEAGGPPLVSFCEVVRKDPFYLVGRRGLGRFALGDLARLRFACVSVDGLGRGEIDVAQMFEPHAAMAERQGIGEIVHAASGRGLTSYTTLLAMRPTAERLRVELSAMRRAVAT
jgi:NitT/TauT family transport system substrate-binding protein